MAAAVSVPTLRDPARPSSQRFCETRRGRAGRAMGATGPTR